MGYNTGVIIMNDSMSAIKKYPEEFVENLDRAMLELGHHEFSGDVSVGGHVNAATVFHQAHADVTGVYALGGNCASQLGLSYNGGKHHSSEDKLKILKNLASEMGYRIVRKKC